jgi:RNA polymerase sporulation-specific sigma factor
LVNELKSALERLPQKEQLVLSSVYLHNQEPREIAQSLSVSTTHVYRLQKAGIRRVRGMLSKLMQQWR